MIKIENIKKTYTNNENQNVIDGLNLEVAKGEIIGIIGESGVGKTTLLNIVGGLIKPDSGKISINNKSSSNIFSDIDRVKTFGYIFQSDFLLPEFNVLDNLVLPQIIAMKSYHESILKSHELLKFLNLEKITKKYPNQLSVGQCQRISILRSIVNDPMVLLADEPTGNLDEKNSELILDLFVKLNESLHLTILIATHDKKVLNICDSSYRMKDKRLNIR
tara:strand:- start:596 stop:1252 length:657 start_codon:yes stop_codon:yes gene_type:complete